MSQLTESPTLKHILYYRIAGYVTILITYNWFIYLTLKRVEEQLPLHPELEDRLKFNTRYATLWNVTSQMTYAGVALLCDVTSLFGIAPEVPAALRRFRYHFFSGVCFPLAFSIVTFFWPVYFYDRELIYPVISDLIVTKFENLVYHFGIVVYVMYETALLPRKHHFDNSTAFKFMVSVPSFYMVTTLYTGFVDIKSFPYNILNVTLGTAWFYVILASVPMLNVLGYYTQWWWKDWLSGREWREKETVKNE